MGVASLIASLGRIFISLIKAIGWTCIWAGDIEMIMV